MAEQPPPTRAPAPGAESGRRFAGTTALVTNATDPISRRLVAYLHDEGACVGILDANGRAARVVAEALGRRAIPLVGDAACADDMEGAIYRCRCAFGRLDVVVHVLPGDPDGDGATASSRGDAS